MVLNGKEKRILRARGRVLPVQVAVGRHGLSESVLNEIRNLLAAREVIKVSVSGDGERRVAICAAICAALGCEEIARTGRSCLFARGPNPEEA